MNNNNNMCSTQINEDEIMISKRVNLFNNISVGNDGKINGINIYKKKFIVEFDLITGGLTVESNKCIKNILNDTAPDYSIFLSSVRIQFDGNKSTNYEQTLSVIKIGVTCCDDYFYKTETEDIYLNSTPNFIYLYRSLSDKPIKKLIKMNDKKFKLTFKNAIPKNGKIVLNIFITYLKD